MTPEKTLMGEVNADRGSKRRDPALDTFKGILIALVVFGHAFYGYRSIEPVGMLVQTIYVFHMPAFIFVSGYFSKVEGNVVRGVAQLAVTYILFNSALMWFCLTVLGTKPSMLTPYYSTWYLLALIWWRLSLPFLFRFRPVLVVSVVVALAVGFSADIDNRLALARTIAFYPFFIAGFLFSQRVNASAEHRRRVPQLAGIIVLVAGIALCAWCVDALNITMNDELMVAYKGNLANDLVRRIALMACAAIVIAGLWTAMPRRPVPLLTTWGRNSLTIYFFHRFVSLGVLQLLPAASFSAVTVAVAIATSVLVLVVFSSNRVNRIYRSVLAKICAQFERGTQDGGEARFKRGGQVLLGLLIAMWIVAMVIRGMMLS